MSDKNVQRKMIQRRCEALKALLDSLKGTMSIDRCLGEVELINGRANRCSDDEIDELGQELANLQGAWKQTPAGDGEAIISPSRHEKFLGSITCAADYE
jgi:hypothetical protein